MIGFSVALQFIQIFKTPTNKNSWVKQNVKVEVGIGADILETFNCQIPSILQNGIMFKYYICIFKRFFSTSIIM